MKTKTFLIFPIIIIVGFFIFSDVQASLAPQVYLTDIDITKNTFEPGEEIEGAVSLLNYENLVVSDLVFHYQVLSHEINGVATKIIDEQIDDKLFTVSSKKELRRIFEYVLPSNLPQDNFKFRVQLANSRGEEMGWIDKIISVGGNGKFLTLDNNWLIKEGEKFSPGAGVSYRAGQIPEVEFEIINESSFTIEAFPKIITYKRNVSEPLREQRASPLILKPGEKKIQNLFLPQLNKPESYLSEVRLYDNKTEEAISNPIYFRWLIRGEDVEILFVKLDQMSYKEGEKAEIEIQMAGPFNYHILEKTSKGILDVKIFNDKGELIGESRKEIDLIDQTINMNVLIKKDVERPKIKTKIIKDGKIIDEYSFRVAPEQDELSQLKENRLGFWINVLKTIMIIVVLLAIIIFSIYYYSKKMRKPDKFKKRKIILPILFLLISIALGFSFRIKEASAAVEVTGGCRDTLMIFNTPYPNRVYNVDDVVNFSGKFKSAGSGSSSFFNKISFFITEDKDTPIIDCCGGTIDECEWNQEKSCMCKEGYLNYYGASSSFYGYTTDRAIRWFDEVKFLDESEPGIYKLGTVYPSDTLYGDPWVAFNQSFIIPDDLGFFGPVRFYVQYSGTHLTENWQWSISYQKGWIIKNKPPYVESPDLNGNPSYCENLMGQGRISLKWIYQDREGDKEFQYHLQLAVDSSFSQDTIVVDYYSGARDDPAGTIVTSPNIIVFHEPNSDELEIGYNNTYWWRVKVKDENGVWSKWERGPEFETPAHAYPWPKFAWKTKEFIAGEKVLFKDNDSICFKDDGSQYFCRDLKNKIRFEWDFDYEPLEGFTIDSNEINTSHIYSEKGQYIVRLRIVDRDAGSCFSSSNIDITKEGEKPPSWRPSVPTSFLENFLSIASIFFLK